MEVLLQQIINGLVLGSMYALVALGYTMVYGIIGLINFAHGEILMVGAMTSWTIISLMKDLDYGKGYRYAHDEADGFAAGERYLPDGMKDALFYEPVERGLEIKIAAKLRELRALNAKSNI